MFGPDQYYCVFPCRVVGLVVRGGFLPMARDSITAVAIEPSRVQNEGAQVCAPQLTGKLLFWTRHELLSGAGCFPL